MGNFLVATSTITNHISPNYEEIFHKYVHKQRECVLLQTLFFLLKPENLVFVAGYQMISDTWKLLVMASGDKNTVIWDPQTQIVYMEAQSKVTH